MKIDLIPLLKVRCHFPFGISRSSESVLGLCDSFPEMIVESSQVLGSNHCGLCLGMTFFFSEQVGLFSKIAKEWAYACCIGDLIV